MFLLHRHALSPLRHLYPKHVFDILRVVHYAKYEVIEETIGQWERRCHIRGLLSFPNEEQY